MSVQWTEDQKKVIELRNRNILVSAAAGSGKTAVLVERIIQRLLDERDPLGCRQALDRDIYRSGSSGNERANPGCH